MLIKNARTIIIKESDLVLVHIFLEDRGVDNIIKNRSQRFVPVVECISELSIGNMYRRLTMVFRSGAFVEEFFAQKRSIIVIETNLETTPFNRARRRRRTR